MRGTSSFINDFLQKCLLLSSVCRTSSYSLTSFPCSLLVSPRSKFMKGETSVVSSKLPSLQLTAYISPTPQLSVLPGRNILSFRRTAEYTPLHVTLRMKDAAQKRVILWLYNSIQRISTFKHLRDVESAKKETTNKGINMNQHSHLRTCFMF